MDRDLHDRHLVEDLANELVRNGLVAGRIQAALRKVAFRRSEEVGQAWERPARIAARVGREHGLTGRNALGRS